MSWRKLMEGNSTLGDPMRIIKIFHEEGEWIWSFWEFSFSILESTSLSIAWWVLTLPASEPISRELDSHLNWLLEGKTQTLICIIMECFYFIYEDATIRDSSLLPFSHSLLHYSHVSIWWHTSVNDSCALLSPVDDQAWVNDLWLCNMSPIIFVSQN